MAQVTSQVRQGGVMVRAGKAVKLAAVIATAALIGVGATGCATESSGAHSVSGVITEAPDDPCPGSDGDGPQATPAYALSQAANAISDVVEKRNNSGYTSIALCAETNEVLLFWKGELPDEVKSTIDGLDTQVTVRSAPYSEAELRAVADKVWADRGTWEGKGAQITESTSPASGEYVQIGVAGSADLQIVQAQMAKKYGTTPPIRVVKRDGGEAL